jgi:hypothetical protein
MRRRQYASLLVLGLAGCGDLAGVDDETPTVTTDSDVAPTATPTDGDSSSARGRPVRVRNERSSAQYVTVAVYDDGEVVFLRNRDVPARERSSLGRVALDPGTYRVVGETAAGDRTTRTVQVGAADAGFAVHVGRGALTVLRRVDCGPDCRPLSTDRTSTERSPLSDASGEVELRNAGAEPRVVTLTLVADGSPVLEYDYEVPGKTVLAVPAFERGRDYRVRVETEGEVRTYPWSVGDGRSLSVDVSGGEVAFRCGWRNRDLRLRNEDDVSHRLSVEIVAGDDAVHRAAYDLPPGETRLDPRVVENAGRYEFRISSDRGEEASYVWNVCPPRGPVWVVVDDDGVQVSVRPS